MPARPNRPRLALSGSGLGGSVLDGGLSRGGAWLGRGESAFDAPHELLQQLVGDVLHYSASELSRLAGDRELGRHVHPGGRAALRRGELNRDSGTGRAIAAFVLALGLDDRPVGHIITLDEVP